MTEPITSLTPPWLAQAGLSAGPRDITRRMADLVRDWEAVGDRRAIFLSCYAMMTHNMLASIDAGDFHDSRWVHALLERFAGYYFHALEMADSGDPGVPAAWRLAFETAASGRGHIMQHLLLGMNAHINYDLVLCLDDVLSLEWDELTPDQRQARFEDHCRVNDIIAATIDAVQDQVVERYSPLMDVFDVALGPLDEWLIRRLTIRWRDEVWGRALERLGLPDAAEREAVRVKIEEESLMRGHLIRVEKIVAALAELVNR